MRQRPLAVHVRAISPCSTRGLIRAGTLALPVRLGRGGVRSLKREGDGATPRGRFQITGGYWRADRLARPRSGLALRPLKPDDGWCDAPADRNYNRPVRLPYPASHETLWRADHLYDVVLTLSHNLRPRVRGHGSAVFVHLSGADPTAGCVALSRRDMRKLLGHLAFGAMLVIH